MLGGRTAEEGGQAQRWGGAGDVEPCADRHCRGRSQAGGGGGEAAGDLGPAAQSRAGTSLKHRAGSRPELRRSPQTPSLWTEVGEGYSPGGLTRCLETCPSPTIP